MSEPEREDILRKKTQMEQQIRTLNKQIDVEETVRDAMRNNPRLRELIARRYGNRILAFYYKVFKISLAEESKELEVPS